MPKMLTEIDHMTLHPDEAGISTVSVWFTEGRSNQDRVTFAPYDLFNYPHFCARVLEVTGHLFCSHEVEDAPDPWQAEIRWRRLLASKLETAEVASHAGFHWKPLIP
jgi:hypothetical protein